MLSRLPADDAIVAYIDFAALRRGGILQLLDGSKAGEDPEYQSFVARTEFDYKEDLDTAMVALAPTGKFMLLKGRFDWKSLTSYVRSVEGNCNNSFCRLTGSAADRRISFFPLQTGVMALAVSPDESAALRLNGSSRSGPVDLPSAPVWLLIPPSVVRSGQRLPEGTQMFARSLERAESVVLTLEPESQAFAARLHVRCSSESDAAALAAQLSKTTNLLRELISRENQQPNPNDLSGFLTSGSFRNEGVRVEGYWPVPRAMINNLLGS
jgi:hypothetical protein